MKTLLFKFSMIAVFALVLCIGADRADADDTGYGFVLAYSHRTKEAFHTPVFGHPVNGKSLNEREYVADIKQIRNLEAAFEDFLKVKFRINSLLYSFIARTGFKSEDIATGRLESEKNDLMIQGISAKIVPDFAPEW